MRTLLLHTICDDLSITRPGETSRNLVRLLELLHFLMGCNPRGTPRGDTYACPSVRYLAERLGLSRRHTLRLLLRLEHSEYLQVTRRFAREIRHQLPNLYRIGKRLRHVLARSNARKSLNPVGVTSLSHKPATQRPSVARRGPIRARDGP